MAYMRPISQNQDKVGVVFFLYTDLKVHPNFIVKDLLVYCQDLLFRFWSGTPTWV